MADETKPEETKVEERDLTAVLVPAGQLTVERVHAIVRESGRHAALVRVTPLPKVNLTQIEVHDLRGMPMEDPALVGLSSLSGNHLEECRTVLDGLREAGVDGVPVVIGGTIPPSDEPVLAEIGIRAVFGSGTPLRTILASIAALLDD